jgi:Uncharacterized protein conserved in bacteria (DUF2252)
MVNRRGRQAAGMGTLSAWYDQLPVGVLMNLVHDEVRVKRVTKKEARTFERDVQQAYARDSTRVFAKRTREVEGDLRIVADPPLIIPIEDIIVPGSEWEDPAPLIKKLLERFAGKSTYRHHGERVVAGQRLMQAATDIFLGWIRIKGLDGVTRDYYVRQFHDWKGGADVDNLQVPGATLYARVCGATLARAHARWGDRIAISSYLGKGDAFDSAIADFSARYADQNERDYRAFNEAVNSGRLTAQTGL